jgi:hypothetical protein
VYGNAGQTIDTITMNNSINHNTLHNTAQKGKEKRPTPHRRVSKCDFEAWSIESEPKRKHVIISILMTARDDDDDDDYDDDEDKPVKIHLHIHK